MIPQTPDGIAVAKLNFKLKLDCNCETQVCAHAGRGIAALLDAAYAKGRQDGVKEALQGVVRVAAKEGLQVRRGSRAATPSRRTGKSRLQ